MNGHTGKYTLQSGATRWRMVYDLPPDPDTGERRQVTKRGFETKAEADKALREALSLADQGVTVALSKATVADYLRAWLKGIRVKPTTRSNYRTSIVIHATPRIGGIKLQQLQPEHLDSLYRDLEERGKAAGPCRTAGITCSQHGCSPDEHDGLAPKSVRHVHTAVRKALQDAAERGHVLRNVADLANPPTQKQARSKRARDKVWTTGQLRTFLDATTDEPLWPLFRLIAATGLRRGEAVGLPWRGVDLDEGTLSVVQTVTVAEGRLVWSDDAKTLAGERTLQLDAATVDVLRDQRRAQLEQRLAAGPAWSHERDLVFTRPDGTVWPPKGVSKRFTDLVDREGLPRVGVHGLRHTYATASLRAGVSPEVLAARLGHADVATLLSIYAHVLGTDDQDAADRAAAAVFGS